MQKWEYISVEIEDGHPRYVNGQELRDWKRLGMHDFSNRLGDEGWELVSASVIGMGKYQQRVFKRTRL